MRDIVPKLIINELMEIQPIMRTFYPSSIRNFFTVQEKKIVKDNAVYYRLTNVTESIKSWIDSQPKDWYHAHYSEQILYIDENRTLIQKHWYYDVNEQLYSMLLLKWA